MDKINRLRNSAAITLTSMLLTVLIAPAAYAMCPAIFSPPQRAMMPDNDTNGLLVFSEVDNEEILVLGPSFHGKARDFGMVLPLPSKPALKEADEKLFTQLEDLTNPFITPRFGMESSAILASPTSKSSVTIIEQKNVGDFKATILTAEGIDALTEWLDSNGYVYTNRDRSNFEYYVTKGGYFFVTLKVNMAKAEVDDQGNIAGKLRPIEFVFSSERPMLPIRIMAQDMEAMSFTLYTLSERPYYIPAIDVVYSKKLADTDLETAPALKKYDATDKWLVRGKVNFDPVLIEEDLFLEKGASLMSVASPANSIKVNPHLLSTSSGIMEGQSQKTLYLDDLTVLSDEIKDLQSSMAAMRAQMLSTTYLAIGIAIAAFGIGIPILIGALTKSGATN